MSSSWGNHFKIMFWIRSTLWRNWCVMFLHRLRTTSGALKKDCYYTQVPYLCSLWHNIVNTHHLFLKQILVDFHVWNMSWQCLCMYIASLSVNVYTDRFSCHLLLSPILHFNTSPEALGILLKFSDNHSSAYGFFSWKNRLLAIMSGRRSRLSIANIRMLFKSLPKV